MFTNRSVRLLLLAIAVVPGTVALGSIKMQEHSTAVAQDVTEALSLMRAEVYNRRDAETFDTLAWALSRSGRWREARQAMHEALRWGIRNAGMFYRAGTIEQALGNHTQARVFFQSAQKTDPTFDEQARRAAGLGLEPGPKGPVEVNK